MTARMLLSAKGSQPGHFTPPVVVPSVVEMVAYPDAGAVLGQNYPSAVYYNGVTYFGYDNGDNGNIEVRTYTHATGVTSAATVVKAAWQKETHDPPALFMRPSDHKLMVFYMLHSGVQARLRIASSSESIAAFGAEINLATMLGATDYTYPSVLYLASESAFYLFFRDDNTTGVDGTRASLCYSKSLDDGVTWSTRVKLHAPTNKRPYWMVRGNGADRYDVFISQDDRAHVDNVPAAHFYYQAGAYHKSDGTVIGGGLPMAYSSFTQVDAGAVGSVDPMDIAYSGGQPVMGSRVWRPPAPTGGTNSYYYVWSGSAWSTHLIGTDSDEVVIIPAHPGTIYRRKLVSAGQYEVYRDKTADGGVNWSTTQVTFGSPHLINYIVGVKDNADLAAIWSIGVYVSATSFDFGISGAIDPTSA